MKTAIILGGADCVWQDYESLKHLHDKAQIIAVNDAGYEFSGKLTAWATLHPEKMPKWKAKRQANGFDMDFITVGYGKKGFHIPSSVDYWLECWRSEKSISGSSGLYAVQVAIELKFDEIWLCGVPMNTDKNIFRNEAWKVANDYRDVWLERLPELKGKVFSCSGWTKEVLNNAQAN